jgi:RNA polymerase sigma-70 factor (ECF subfamily)
MRKSQSTTDQDWFIEQVRGEQAGLRAFVRMSGLRAKVVEDDAQEAFFVSWQKLGEFQRETNFGAWLRTIARNLVQNELRREERRRRVIGELVAEQLAEQAIRHPEFADATHDHDADLLSALKRCLRELPEQSPEISLTEGEAISARRTGSPQRVQTVQLDRAADNARGAGRSTLIESVSDNFRKENMHRFCGVVPGGMQSGAKAFVDRSAPKRKLLRGQAWPAELDGADLVQTFQAER